MEPSALNRFQEQANIYGQSRIVAEIDQFGAAELTENDYLTAQGDVYLKTNSGAFKLRYCLIMGNEIYFQKTSKSVKHDFMHCLTGTFLDLPDPLESEGKTFFPIKI